MDRKPWHILFTNNHSLNFISQVRPTGSRKPSINVSSGNDYDLFLLKDLAEGEGDLTKRIHINSRDESGERAHWINLFAEKLQRILKDIKGNADSLNQSSSTLTDVSHQLTQGAQSASDKAHGVAAAAEEMSANMNSVAAASEEAATNVSMVASASEEMAINY